MRKLFAILSLLVIASMALAACGGGGGAPEPTQAPEATAAPEPGEVRANVLRINLGTYPDIIDPQVSSFVNEIAHLKLFYEGLTKFNEKLETVPGAAESWEYNDDATQLTFHLRDGLTYSDGSLLNAERFAYSIRRNINPATGGEYASITDEILNASEWRSGVASTCDSVVTAQEAYDTAKAASDAAPTDTALAEATAAAEALLGQAVCTEEEIAAIAESIGVKTSHADGSDCAVNADTGNAYDDADCNTLTLTLAKPAPYFHTIMGIWVAFPAKQESIEEGGKVWWTSPVFQIGNGPFIWTVGEPFVRGYFTPNANYWGDKPSYDLEYRYITDSAVAFQAYRNGELDIVASAAEDLPTIEADPNLTAQHMLYPGACTILIKFGLAAKYTAPDGSTYDSPFLDKKVREAFALAFDAESYSRDVNGGLSTPTWTWIPPGFPGYDPESPLRFDSEAARAALAESTYGGPEALNALGLKLTFGDTPRNRLHSEWLVANYKEHLGVEIALDPIETTTFTAITKDPATFPLLARQSWCADYPDQQNWLSVYWKSTTSFANRQGYENLEFDALIDQADVELDPAKRTDLYAQAQQLLLDDIPSAFGYNTANHYLVQPWVKGIVTTPQDSDWPGSFSVHTITIDTRMSAP
ncbi:MAG: peptide ABC transporter substrate-binding protein [Chloroflexi bacterium]|nr:peptide ABC transporter substrate-binding protein [Chloroflexota bacterium]